MRILVIAESAVTIRTIEKTINIAGISTEIAMNMDTALSAINQEQFDLICVPYYFHKLNGIELSRKIRGSNKNQNCPIVLLTSEDNATILSRCQKAGITDIDIYAKNDLTSFSNYLYLLKSRQTINVEESSQVLICQTSTAEQEILLPTFQSMKLDTLVLDSLNDVTPNNLISSDLSIVRIYSLEDLKKLESMLQPFMSNNEYQGSPILAIIDNNLSINNYHLLQAGVADLINSPIDKAELSLRSTHLIKSKLLTEKLVDQEKRFETLVMSDQLTSLYNRHCLAQIAPKYVSESQRHAYAISLIYGEIVSYDEIRESGREMTDHVIIEIAEILKESCRSEDLAVRYGQHQFVILLSHCNLDMAEQKIEHIQNRISHLTKASTPVLMNFGAACVQSEDDYNALFSRALHQMTDITGTV